MTGRQLVAMASVVLVLVALVCILGYANLPAARHYQLFGDADSLFLALSQFESDVTLDELEAQLGPAEMVKESRRQGLIAGHKANLSKDASSYPDWCDRRRSVC